MTHTSWGGGLPVCRFFVKVVHPGVMDWANEQSHTPVKTYLSQDTSISIWLPLFCNARILNPNFILEYT
jgi:hypothetical protein